MGWQTAAALNGLIALCYVCISALITQGLIRTRQLRVNPLAFATAAIFLTCALHHGHHATHLLLAYGGDEGASELAAVRLVFGSWHTVAIDAVGAAVAVTYLALRSSYRALLNTPQMFDDAVRSAAEERLRQLAYTDLLTGIPNRTAFQTLADRLAREGGDAVVLYIDLDGFKEINDAHGHETGDRVLRAVAQRLVTSCGSDEHAFRLGGDEFAVVGIGEVVAAGEELAGRARATISRPLVLREGVLSVDASVGVAAGNAAEGVDELLRRADRAMYNIKRARHLPLPSGMPEAQARLDSPVPPPRVAPLRRT